MLLPAFPPTATPGSRRAVDLTGFDSKSGLLEAPTASTAVQGGKNQEPCRKGVNHVFSSCTFGRQEAGRAMLQGADREKQKHKLKEDPPQICLSFFFEDVCDGETAGRTDLPCCPHPPQSSTCPKLPGVTQSIPSDLSAAWTSLWEDELSQQHPHQCLDWQRYDRDLLSLSSGHPAAFFSHVSIQIRQSELAGRTRPPSPQTHPGDMLSSAVHIMFDPAEHSPVHLLL